MLPLHDWQPKWNNGMLPLCTVNYLAHFYLADPEPELMFGNYIGDGVRGGDLGGLPSEIARGVRFHRFIDSYTDAHQEVVSAKSLFYQSQGKFSPVVVDVLFDYLLASEWSSYHAESLNSFAQRCYALIEERIHLMPIRSIRFYQYMRMNDLLNQYATKSGIEMVLNGMDHRTKFESKMSEAFKGLDANFIAFKGNFERFFPELVEATTKWKKEN